MLIISTISEASFQHFQGSTSRELWLALERAYAPNTTSREFTLKTQLLRITMKGDETPMAYLTRAQEYATALANIGEPTKDKDLVMLVVSGLREEYNSLKSNLLARQPPITFNELHGLLTDHDYLINKSNFNTVANVQPQTFAAQTGSPLQNFTPLRSQLQQLASQLGYQLNPVVPSNSQPQVHYTSPSGNNNRGSRRGNLRGYSCGQVYNRNRDNTGSSRRFDWPSTQNTMYGHCNCCGIGHLSSQCPNQSSNSSARSNLQANLASFS